MKKTNKLIILVIIGCILSEPIVFKDFQYVRFKNEESEQSENTFTSLINNTDNIECDLTTSKVKLHTKEWDIARVELRNYEEEGQATTQVDFYKTINEEDEESLLKIKKHVAQGDLRTIIQKFQTDFNLWKPIPNMVSTVALKPTRRRRLRK
jgi:hypothetical protein